MWSEEYLERNIKVKKGKEPKKQYYVYVLEASLAFQNGMTIPLMSEFLSYTEGDTATNKQDCELFNHGYYLFKSREIALTTPESHAVRFLFHKAKILQIRKQLFSFL